LIVYDIERGILKNSISLNPISQDVEFIFEDDQGFNTIGMCRSSNITPNGEYRLCIFTVYKEKLGKIGC
jgi:phosphoribosylamine-glycine ligase